MTKFFSYHSEKLIHDKPKLIFQLVRTFQCEYLFLLCIFHVVSHMFYQIFKNTYFGTFDIMSKVLFLLIIWLSNISTLSLPAEAYSRNASSALKLISTFLFFFCLRQIGVKQITSSTLNSKQNYWNEAKWTLTWFQSQIVSEGPGGSMS